MRGVRVADFSLLLPGPFATVLMADLGADVVKVEPPAGDFARKMPVAMFRMANRNKRSIAVDLKDPASAGLVERLAKWADVAIEGFRPGVADRLGIGYEALSAINPGLVYCSISGYGQTGPERLRPGHDLNYLAAAGALALPGHWLEPPKRSGIPVADLAAGSFAVVAILSALHARNATGKGASLDLSLAEAALSLACVRYGPTLDRPRRDHMYPTNDIFETADGKALAFGIVEQHFWEALVDAVGHVEPKLRDPKYAQEPGRREHGDELSRLLKAMFLTRPAAEWMGLFEGHDVPVSHVLTPAEAVQSPQMAARDMMLTCEGEAHVPFPVTVNGKRGGAVRRNAPPLAADTDAILAELGYSVEDARALKATGVLNVAGGA
ncbi:CaiB/BaiF CoA transferase family protein [Futiania mangrovi]|uniref:CoA transferase n=1 Tax=Futiania mangrovi TaxID=2959716 RepID=A0A9J6PKD8_9PROT|nr:CaiB/BaiF CoA-transferase family protein [Futiania mangrovii]MCP1337031.1 CoA transferase [Futiania mangrovii]